MTPKSWQQYGNLSNAPAIRFEIPWFLCFLPSVQQCHMCLTLHGSRPNGVVCAGVFLFVLLLANVALQEVQQRSSDHIFPFCKI